MDASSGDELSGDETSVHRKLRRNRRRRTKEGRGRWRKRRRRRKNRRKREMGRKANMRKMD